jgi:hypothetical protein
LSHYQGHQGGEHMDDDKNVSRETSFAQRKPRKAQQLARIRCWICNEYGHYQSDCPQKKKCSIPTRWDCKYWIPPKGAMVRLDQEWYYMAMRMMNVQIVRFFSGKIERVCCQYVPYN